MLTAGMATPVYEPFRFDASFQVAKTGLPRRTAHRPGRSSADPGERDNWVCRGDHDDAGGSAIASSQEHPHHYQCGEYRDGIELECAAGNHAYRRQPSLGWCIFAGGTFGDRGAFGRGDGSALSERNGSGCGTRRDPDSSRRSRGVFAPMARQARQVRLWSPTRARWGASVRRLFARLPNWIC